ncbi:DNA/RNA nuclease SfsA [Clostridium isatidis]
MQQTTIIEAKSIIGVKREVTFPNVPMERAIHQLEKLGELLNKGYRVQYYFVSLSPIVRKVIIDDYYKEYKELLRTCVEEGLSIKGITLQYNGSEIIAREGLKIEF